MLQTTRVGVTRPWCGWLSQSVSARPAASCDVPCPGTSSSAGAPRRFSAEVVQWPDNNGANQQWNVSVSNGYATLVNRSSGKALEVQGASTADGGNVVQYSSWNGANQQWQLVKVG